MRTRVDDLRGRRVLVTGASSGIGLATAQLLTAGGARVALLARDDDALREAAASCGHGAVAVSADVSDPGAVSAAVARARAELGGLDVVVVNAGAATFGAFAETDPADFDHVVAVTFTGAVTTIRAALRELGPDGGTIVVTGSVAGRMPVPLMSPYVAAKHALRGFVRTLRIELRATRSPVRVSLVAPGPVDTPFWRRVRRVRGTQVPSTPDAYAPTEVARAIAACAVRPRREVTVGGAGALLAAGANLGAAVFEPLAALAARRVLARPRQAGGAGSLRAPAGPHGLDGGLDGRASVAVGLRTGAEPRHG